MDLVLLKHSCGSCLLHTTCLLSTGEELCPISCNINKIVILTVSSLMANHFYYPINKGFLICAVRSQNCLLIKTLSTCLSLLLLFSLTPLAWGERETESKSLMHCSCWLKPDWKGQTKGGVKIPRNAGKCLVVLLWWSHQKYVLKEKQEVKVIPERMEFFHPHCFRLFAWCEWMCKSVLGSYS